MKKISLLTVVLLGGVAYLGAYQSELLKSWFNKAKEMFNGIINK